MRGGRSGCRGGPASGRVDGAGLSQDVAQHLEEIVGRPVADNAVDFAPVLHEDEGRHHVDAAAQVQTGGFRPRDVDEADGRLGRDGALLIAGQHVAAEYAAVLTIGMLEHEQFDGRRLRARAGLERRNQLIARRKACEHGEHAEPEHDATHGTGPLQVAAWAAYGSATIGKTIALRKR